MTDSPTDPRVDKRRVTMRNTATALDENGEVGIVEMKAVDYVRPDILDAYVADAETKWQIVEVSEEPDAGPAGYDGATFVPAHLDHPLAGQLFPAEGEQARLLQESAAAAAEEASR